MATKIKLYGSTDITPDDIPAGVTPTRADILHIWAGCLGGGCSGSYNPPDWQTSTAWSFGGYGSGDLKNTQSTNENIRGFIQNEHRNSGWNSFLNNNAQNKRVLGRAGTDIPSGSVIEYVRVWVRAGTGELPQKYLQPFWQSSLTADGAPDGSGSTQFPSISSGKTWDTPTKFVCNKASAGYDAIQKSSKWTTVPVSGEVWNAALMQQLAWGVRHGRRGQDGNPSNSGTGQFLGIAALMIEVGYDAAVDYEVTTGPALSVDGTSATITGTVNPEGDAAGDYFFEYGTSEALGTATAAQPQLGTGEEYETQAALTGLVSDTLYYYRAAATDSNGLVHYGAKLTFLTVSPCSTRTTLVGG